MLVQGSRFALLHGDGPRPSFSIYAMKSDLKSTVKGVDLVGTQPNKQANQIHWSPQGKYLVLGGLKVHTLPYLDLPYLTLPYPTPPYADIHCPALPSLALFCPALACCCPSLLWQQQGSCIPSSQTSP